MSDITLDVGSFFRRAGQIIDGWKDGSEKSDLAGFKDLDALWVIVGDPADEVAGKKGPSLQTWLLGYEFPSTIMLFTKEPAPKVTFVCSSSKAKILKQLQDKAGEMIGIEVLVKGKDAASAEIIPNLVKSINGNKYGHLPKDKATGKMIDEWNKAVQAAEPAIEIVDIASPMGTVLAPKDGEEAKTVLIGAKLVSTAMVHYFKPKMESIIDKGSKVPHDELAALVEEKIGTDDKPADAKLWRKNPDLGDVDFSSTDWIYTPIIQSGGKYDLKTSATPNSDPLKPGVILASLGIRYKSYCASIGRTFLIDPVKAQERNYALLLEVQTEVVKMMKVGVPLKDVYAAAVNVVKSKKPELESSFVKSIGFATGIEFRDSTSMLNAKATKSLKETSVYTLSLGFADLDDPKKSGKKYSLLLIDTVKVGREGGVLLTEGCKKLNDIVMDLGEDEDEPVPEPKKAAAKPAKAKPASANIVGGKVLRTKTRNAGREETEASGAQRIKEHQVTLHAQRQQEGLEKWKNGGGGGNDGRGKAIKKFESYKREEQIPTRVEDRRIYVDEQRMTVLLPVYGFATPFHISTIKNITKTEEADNTVLRINFQSPGQIAGKKEDMPFEDPDATFLRSATFRSSDSRHMNRVYESITAMRKAATKKESEKKELADVVQQDKLVEVKGRKAVRLPDVYPKPSTEGKKLPGDLEIHTNGLRYISPHGQRVDLLFHNIKHLFFQPSEKELIVLLHVHLVAPIMLGKKKTYDVQFYREASDMAFDETGNRKRKSRYGDEDEIEQEQEDRKRRQAIDREFQAFAKRVTEAAQAQDYELEVDIPFRDLAFFGVPHRTNVLLQPSMDCLVHLSEAPFTVITLADVEHVHFERIAFGLKQFDLVFVLKDFKKMPVHINSIPVEHLDNVKEWLDSVDLPISEGPVNLSWPAIMKTINDDPYEFFNEGGWGFLTGVDEHGDEDASESSEESEFDVSDVGGSSDDDDSDASSYGDDDASNDDSGSGFEESDEGEDWDELEKKAEKADKNHRAVNGDESDDGKKKKRR